jgi:hypothetical protein
VLGTKLISRAERDRRADPGRSAITRNQHSSTNAMERRQLRPRYPCSKNSEDSWDPSAST